MSDRINRKIEIPSDISHIKKVSNEIVKGLKQVGIVETLQFDIRLVVEEAVRNAIEHGNCYDKDLPVKILYSIDRSKCVIEIEDQGKGFDVTRVPDPRKQENLVKAGGRGVFLIRKLMDRVEYNEIGNKVKITKYFK
ncbi:MAG: ATP-binding protein [Candidatus Omnitrophica bacterium]|nr:ATP-binding protein [Candidatus Omnitrophota bacterium]